jgi:aminopeptidase N
MFRTALFLSLIFLTLWSDAQSFDKWQSSYNELYWKNRKPFEGYWQQDVHYSIRARLDDKTDIITASEILTYQNNSPDTLYEVYFHLYQNAFQPGSYMSELMESGKIETTYGKYEAQKLGTEILEVQQGESKITPIFDNTIMRLNLVEPILPGRRAEFYIAFKTYFDHGSLRRRMKLFDHDGVKHYDGVHWYPRICVYDRKFGWTTDQHLGKEFYGDYGVYDVELQLPAPYIIEATGVLVNEKEVLPDALRQKIDIKNFENYVGALTKPVPDDGTYKNWRYHAENVHDFAFTADPTYRIGEVVWNGIRCIAIAQEPNAAGWQKTAQFVADVVKTYSEDFGMYAYPKMVAADARDGMEYPMLTLNGGSWPGHRYVIAHEVGHNWFFGMVGNNETYAAGMDEGFTQFLTAWSLKKTAKISGFPNAVDPGVVYMGYMNHATQDNTARLNIHSDNFGSAERHGGGYGQVYYKTATMLYNLQYVLGDALFEDAMKHYFNQWKFAHPYWEDFRNSIIQYTKVDLNWFFDQWLTTTQTIDYKVGKIKRLKSSGKAAYAYEVTLKRKGDMQMPLDIRAIDRQGGSYEYHIPNTWFEKEGGHAILPAWKAWDILYPEYKARIELNAPLKNLVIDPSDRLADIYRLDNSKKFPLSVKLDGLKSQGVSYNKYQITWRPDVWYNAVDGIKAGLHLDGQYFRYRHKFDLNLWYNTGLLPFETVENYDLLSYRLKYSDRLFKRSEWEIDSRLLDGITLNALSLNHRFSNGNRLSGGFKSLWMHDVRYQNRWEGVASDEEKWNNFMQVMFSHPYKWMKGSGSIKLDARASAFTSDFQYSWLGLESKHSQPMGRTALKTRIFGRVYGGKNLATMSQLYLGGASNEEMLESKYTRSRGLYPDEWGALQNGFNQLHVPGGLNVRGYSNYLATNSQEQDTFFTYAGRAGASVNAEWDFTGLIPVKMPKIASTLRLNTYLFGDAGMLWNDAGNSGIRKDAGLGTLWTLNAGKFTKTEPLQIRVDFPFFMNRIPVDEANYLGFRWMIGIHKAI